MTETYAERSFSETLEARAREAIKLQGRQRESVTQSAFLIDDIALTLDQVDQLRSLERHIKQNLLDAECFIGTELLQMEDRTPRYSPYRFPEREKLQRRLEQIGRERRQFIVAHAMKMNSLQDRLLGLLKKHRQLEFT